MISKFLSRVQRKVWITLFDEASWIRRTGDFRTQERYGLIDRPNYVYGMLRAADIARYVGVNSATVVEMGVASGAGLLNMIKCAGLITKETGVKFRIVGFDTGSGLPSVEGHKDHPELWNPGDFAMEDRGALQKKIAGKAEIIWGDINETVDDFTASLSDDCPLGFVAIDVDIYSATKAGLRCLTGLATKYLPGVSIYCDDVSFFFANDWCGELAAIHEFNSEQEMRKIGTDRGIAVHRPEIKWWYQKMFVCHVLDHPLRQSSKDRRGLTISEHVVFVRESNL